MAAEQHRRPAVVVVGLNCVTGLQVARVFARRGVRVIGVAPDRHHFCCRTNACDRVFVSETDSPELIDCLVREGALLPERAVLVPCTDNSVLLISRFREKLESLYRISLPPHNVVETLTDKKLFPAFARENGLPVPASVKLSSIDDVRQLTEFRFPAVLKPPVKTPLWQENTREKAVVVGSAGQLEKAFLHYSRWAETLVLQEWIPGPIENHFTCDAYFDADSNPLVVFTSKKLRQWPAQTGVGTLSQVCDNSDVREVAVRLFQAAAYRGLGYVELKRDELTGKYFIIEANIGRPTGRSSCAEAAGVEMLYSMYCDLTGLPLPENRIQKEFGLKWIYWKRDLRAVGYAWRKKNITLREWWRSVKGPKVCAVFSLRDPLPFLFDCLRGVKQLRALRSAWR